MDPFTWIAISLALSVVSYAITAALTKKPVPQKPANLEDFKFPQADEGTPQAIFFGDTWTQGQFIMWYGNLRTTKVKTKAGKK